MKANLAIIKRERKKFEQDAQLLANRIKLLKPFTCRLIFPLNFRFLIFYLYS